MAAVDDLPAFEQFHKTVARTSRAVACRTKAWYISKFHQPMHYLFQGTAVADVKLGRIIVLRFFFIITADTRSGTAADLGNTKVQHFFTCLGGFPGRYNHSGIRDGNADTCHNFFKCLIGNAVVKYVRVNIIRAAHPWNADRMRANAFIRLQMLRMHQYSGKIIAVIVQPEQNA